MCEAARRFRMVAAVGLVLVLAQGRAWGQEPVWERAADFMRRICELPCVVTAKEKPVAAVPPGIFVWERVEARRLFTSEERLRRTGSLLFGLGVSSDCGLTESIVALLKEHSLAGALVLPERGDMLLDSEYSRLLIDLGVIVDQDQFLIR
jgi:hypothetical protein